MGQEKINIIYILNALHSIPLINKLNLFKVYPVTCCEHLAACDAQITLLKNYEEIANLIEKWDIQIIIASDLEYACEALQNIKQRNKCKAFYSDAALCMALDNKESFFKICRQKHIPIPETIPLSNIEGQRLDEKYFDQTYIIKPTNLNGGRGIQILKSKSQIDGKSDYLLQKLIDGQDYSVTCVANNGNVLEWIIYKSIYSNPFSSMIIRERSIDSDINLRIIEFCKKIIRETNYTGFIGFDVVVSHDDGTPYFLECNPLLTQGITFIFSISEALMNSMIYDTSYIEQGIALQNPEETIKFTIDNYYLLTSIMRDPIPILTKLIQHLFSLRKDYTFKMIVKLMRHLIKKHGLRYFSMAIDREVDLLPSFYESPSLTHEHEKAA